MAVFEMIKYHKRGYPSDIPLRIEELAAHFDIQEVHGELAYSLHTEYSYGRRKLNTDLISEFPEILKSHKDSVPQLWKTDEWAKQFAEFVSCLSGEIRPSVIEIHPPFDDYTDMDRFIESYSVFEDIIKGKYPDVEILIENRCGSVYRGGKFLISKIQHMAELCNSIEKNRLSLKLAYDVPGLYTAHNVSNPDQYIELVKQVKEYRELIGGVHIWGKKRSETGRRVSHSGDLSTYFENDAVKDEFLKAFRDCFDDDLPRKMVLEVNNRDEDLLSIIDDLRGNGIAFV